MCEVMNWIVCAILLVISVFDYKRKRIPLYLLVLISVVVVIFVLCFKSDSLLMCLTGGVLGIVFFLVSRFTNEAVGYGDSWIILLLGVYLGQMDALRVFLLAAVGAAIYSLFCLWRYRWKRSVTIAFIPFVTVAYVGVVCL